MEGLSCDYESWACATSSTGAIEERQRSREGEEEERGRCLRLRRSKSMGIDNNNNKNKNKNKKKNQVLLEGYVDEDLARTKSLTDEDLEELKGCLDLGFGFSYDEIPELCNTLPALELCYSMSQKFIDHSSPAPDAEASSSPDSLSSSIANWRISSPGDHPEDVKARLKFWAQAVASVRASIRASPTTYITSAFAREESVQFILLMQLEGRSKGKECEADSPWLLGQSFFPQVGLVIRMEGPKLGSLFLKNQDDFVLDPVLFASLILTHDVVSRIN